MMWRMNGRRGSVLLLLVVLGVACSKKHGDDGTADSGTAPGSGGSSGAGTAGAGPAGDGGAGAGTAGAGTAGASATGGGGSGAGAGMGGSSGVGGLGATGGGGASGAGGEVFDCEGFGVPLDHPIVMNSFTLEMETVTDKGTGLMWQRKLSAADQVTVPSAAGCSNPALAGFSDWRLPTVMELATIVDLAVVLPAIAVQAFPNTPGASFVTSTPVYGGPSTTRWSVDFVTGLTANTTPAPAYVRCVRKDFGPICFTGPRFQINQKASNANGVVTMVDRRTGTSWQQGVSDPMTWQQAKDYCAAFARPGRLPRSKELLSIIDWGAPTGVFTEGFPETPLDAYWSDTPLANTAMAGVITVVLGDARIAGTNTAPATAMHRVRCVVQP